ncbi:MAG: FAD-binding oxidoreductase [Desulfobacterota bacterium]|nr:FAD-binding oxidoreductase [Thermodesulfobacteriota bacterium]
MAENKPRKVVQKRLPREVYSALKNVVGERWIYEQRSVVETYSKLSIEASTFLRKHEKDPHLLPACVVLPNSTEEIQAIVKICNRYRVPFIPFTNGQVFCAPTNAQPTLIIHLSRMNKILRIDTENLSATLQPYVDYGQLQAEAMKRGLWNGGCPLATSLCKLASQYSFAGLWQTDLKYGLLNRNIVSVKMVLPDGEILVTGSRCIPKAGDFWEYGPGPDLLGLQRAAAGTSGIVTEITVKLHTWVGDASFPEIPAGRPSLVDVHEPKYDSPPAPLKNHKLYWIEFKDFQSQIRAMREIAHAGIAIGLNATGVYSAFYCSQTQEMTIQRCRTKFFPDWNCYVILANITSDQQIPYEERVLRQIVEETGGIFLSETHKPEVLDALKPWNYDCIRHTTGFRMNRKMYANAWLPVGPLDSAFETTEQWKKALDLFGECDITDRGGADDTPFVYALQRGHFCFFETDNYPDPVLPEEIKKAQAFGIYGNAVFVTHNLGPMLMAFLNVEPLTTMFPEVGPNAHLLMRKLREVFDPNSVCAPGRQVFTEEEWRQFPEDIKAAVNKMRAMHNLPAVV